MAINRLIISLIKSTGITVSNQNNNLQEFKKIDLNIALPAKNIKVINSFYKGMHDMQRCLRL